MSEVLSQSEIDALLSALTSGEVNAEEIRDQGKGTRIRNYDFRRAMRFSKDHIRIIGRIHEHFARLLATHLSGKLRTVVNIQLESVDQVPYEEFIRSIPTLTVIQVMDFAPMQGNVVVEMNPQIVFGMLDRLMGGVVTGPYKERGLTEIESALLGRTLWELPDFLSEAWKNVEDLRPSMLRVESNPQFLQLTTPNETVLVVTLSARIGNSSGLINICIPHVTIEPIIPKLSTQYFMDGGKSKRRDNLMEMNELTHHVFRADAVISVLLGQADLTVEDLLDLRVGDVIPLSSTIAKPLDVLVNDVPTYKASVGKSHRKYAVKIVEARKEEVGTDERGHEAVSG